MRKYGSQSRETVHEAGYNVVYYNKADKELVLQDTDGTLELWFQNDNHAGYTIEFCGIGYEFARSL